VKRTCFEGGWKCNVVMFVGGVVVWPAGDGLQDVVFLVVLDVERLLRTCGRRMADSKMPTIDPDRRWGHHHPSSNPALAPSSYVTPVNAARCYMWAAACTGNVRSM